MHADRGSRSGGARRADALRVQARKIDPRYTEGELVAVCGAGNQAEAEMIQGMLLAEGIPSVRRSPLPDVLMRAGFHQVLVPASGAEVARALLRQEEPG